MIKLTQILTIPTIAYLADHLVVSPFFDSSHPLVLSMNVAMVSLHARLFADAVITATVMIALSWAPTMLGRLLRAAGVNRGT